MCLLRRTTARSLVVNVTNDYGAGICPLSLVLTRTFVAEDQCGNTSATFVQTIQEATDLSVDSVFKSNVTCHGGSDGHAVASATGGVPPYTFNWGGYNPWPLEEGVYEVTVTDDNLCQDSKSFVITQPPTFFCGTDLRRPELHGSQQRLH